MPSPESPPPPTPSETSPAPHLQWLALLGFVALTFLAAVPGVAFPPGEWYEALTKPSWNPPKWLFGPAWTTLYLMIASSGWLVWCRRGWGRELWVWTGQLALNALWTPLFFGLHRPLLALVEIVILWLAIATTIAVFARVQRAAALLLVPYLGWVSFATALNAALWQLNP